MTDWYVMRATGVVSLILLTLVTVLGIATVNRWRPGRAPRFVTLGLHRSLSLLAVVFVAIHVVTALFDPYAGVTVLSVLVPFAAHWKALWVGLGTVSLDLVAAIIVSSLLRRHLSLRVWRGIHLLSYVSWPVAVVHTLGAGTDASATWLLATTILCIAAVAFAALSRLPLRRGPAPRRLAPQVTM
jgi:methionine sulfoxide reductase heme-binding subunit